MVSNIGGQETPNAEESAAATENEIIETIV